jgi:hypothetical protein
MSTTIAPANPDQARTGPQKKGIFDQVRDWRVPPEVQGVVTWVSVGLLTVAFAIVVWDMVSAVYYIVSNPAPPCSNPPSRQSYPPQLVVVGVCIVTFLLGHLTARLQFIDAKHLARHQLKEVEHPETDSRRRDALIVQALLLVFLLEMIGLLIVEALTLSHNVWPITYYVRCAYNAAGVQSMWAAASILFLVGRWFWLPARRQHGRTSS